MKDIEWMASREMADGKPLLHCSEPALLVNGMGVWVDVYRVSSKGVLVRKHYAHRPPCAYILTNAEAFAEYGELKTFSERLKAERLRTGFTQARAAEWSGVSTRSVEDWERGKEPPLATQEGILARLSKAPDKGA